MKEDVTEVDVDSDRMLALDEQVCFLLYSASRSMTKLYQPLLSPLGLTYPQYLVLLALWEWQSGAELPVNVKQLGQRLSLDSGTLTPLLKRMEANGLVARTRSLTDERQVEVQLTQAGTELKEKARSVPESLLCRFGSELDDILVLRDKLRRLVASIQS